MDELDDEEPEGAQDDLDDEEDDKEGDAEDEEEPKDGGFYIHVAQVISYLYGAWKPNSKRKLEDGDDDGQLVRRPKKGRGRDLKAFFADAKKPEGGTTEG